MSTLQQVCYRIQNFTRHLKTHEKPDVYKCHQCEYTHKLQGEVMRHMRNAHNEKKFACHLCSLKVRTQALLNAHIKYKHERACVTVCEVCGKSLVNKTSYRNHKALYHGDSAHQPGSVMCPKCKALLKSQRGFEAHWYMYHGAENTVEEVEVSEGSQLQMMDLHSIASTVTIATDWPDKCVYTFYACMSTRSGSVLTAAAASHENHTSNKHISVTHLKAEKVSCEKCAKTYNSHNLLKNHMRRVHDQAKQYQCQVCGRQFYDKRKLHRSHVSNACT